MGTKGLEATVPYAACRVVSSQNIKLTILVVIAVTERQLLRHFCFADSLVNPLQGFVENSLKPPGPNKLSNTKHIGLLHV